MRTKVITVDKAINDGNYHWNKSENDCDFHGVIPGYVCGFCLEVKYEDRIDYASCTFTNDYKEIKDPDCGYEDNWNSLGISANLCHLNGWEPTGRIVFRGYFIEEYDFNERDNYYTDASKEVLKEVM